MADYFSPTVVQQTIPSADMTSLERLLLGHIFDAEHDGDGLYFYSSEGPSDMICVRRADLEIVLTASRTADSGVAAWVTEQFEKLVADESGKEQDEIDLDLSEVWWPSIFQDIVKRSSTLRYVTVTMSFTCSKMRDDGFGGMAIFITADDIKSQSTNDFLETCIAEMETLVEDDTQVSSPSPKQPDGETDNATDH